MCSRFCSSEPYSSKVGPNIITPIPPIGFHAPTRAISSLSTRACALLKPPPPYSFGQVGTPQPFSPIASRHAVISGVSLVGPSTLASALPLPFNDGGKLAESQSRTSARKSSSESAGRSISAAVAMKNLTLFTESEYRVWSRCGTFVAVRKAPRGPRARGAGSRSCTRASTGDAGVYEVCDALSRRVDGAAPRGAEGSVRRHGLAGPRGVGSRRARAVARGRVPRGALCRRRTCRAQIGAALPHDRRAADVRRDARHRRMVGPCRRDRDASTVGDPPQRPRRDARGDARLVARSRHVETAKLAPLSDPSQA